MKSAITWIANGKVLLADGRIERTDLHLAQGRIVEIGGRRAAVTALDAAGGWVVPGFIDIHTHGIGREAVSTALEPYAALEAKCGTTTFYPSLFGPPEETIAHLYRHRRASDELRKLPQVGGFRLESPYLAQTGAGLSKDLAPIHPELTRRLLEAGGGHIKLWDLSPELPDAPETIRQLARAGVVCSLAHTRATIAEARAAVDAGARLVTHLFDTFAVPQMTDPGVYPVSLVDYLLTEDRLTCEIIADGTHVHPLLVEKTFRCKPSERLVFVTDGNFGAGLTPGEYDLPQSWGRVVIRGPNDGVRLLDRDMGLAGSALTPIDCFRNAMKLFGKDVAVACRVCALNPARLLGLNKGEIAVGRDADLVVLDEHFEVHATVVGGALIYQR